MFLISRIKGWFHGRPVKAMRSDQCPRCGQYMNKRMEGNKTILSCLRYADHQTICVLRPVPWPGELASEN